MNVPKEDGPTGGGLVRRTTRRAFLRHAAGCLPLLCSAARPDRVFGATGPPLATSRGIVVLTGVADGADQATLGARLAMAEAVRAAELLRGDLELVERRVAGPADAAAALAAAGGPDAPVIVSTVTGRARAALYDGDRPDAVVLDTASGDPVEAPCARAVLRTGMATREAVRALVAHGTADRAEEPWALITSDGAALARWRPGVEALLDTHGARLVAHVALADGAHPRAAIPDLRRNGARHVVVILDAPGGPADPSAAVDEGPHVLLYAVQDDGAPPVPPARAATWHPALFRYGAEQLNERFVRTHGVPMGSAAWSAWIAVKLVADAVLRGARDVRATLADPRARLDGHKGTPLSFRPIDGWLRQPLYITGAAASPAAEVPYGDAPQLPHFCRGPDQR